MQKLEIIKLFRREGYLLDPKLLDYLVKNPQDVEKILSTIKEEKPKTKILTLSLLKKPTFEVLRQFQSPKKLTTNGVVKILVKRYQKLKEILSKRIELVNLVSINKIPSRAKLFSIIGMIREASLDHLLVEDLTGEIEVKINKMDYLVEDEVIGIVCERRGDTFHARKIIFPDVPAYRRSGRVREEIHAVFLSDKVKKDLEKIGRGKLVFYLGSVEDENVFSFSKYGDPCVVRVDGMTIFLTKGDFLSFYQEKFGLGRMDVLLQLLKKRHLNPKIGKLVDEDIFLLDEIPDIIATVAEKSDVRYYKGVMLITCGKKMIDVNLKTKEFSKINF